MTTKRITDVDIIDSLGSNESFFVNQNSTIKQINKENITFGAINGGTGLNTVTTGSYLVGNGTSAMVEKTPDEVLEDIGAVNKAGDTMTGALKMPGGSSVYAESWPTFEFKDADDNTIGAVQVTGSYRTTLTQKIPGETYGERYMLPVPTSGRTSEGWYGFLNTKNHAPTYNVTGLMDLGITTFPTTMSEIASKMTANSMLMVDSRYIISGGSYEISDLGLSNNGIYIFFKGNSASRLSMLHLYGRSTEGVIPWLTAGYYGADDDTVSWTYMMPERLNSHFCGSTLPAAGTPGRIFFKLAE